jgi:RND family efflux transporter MFP subunit
MHNAKRDCIERLLRRPRAALPGMLIAALLPFIVAPSRAQDSQSSAVGSRAEGDDPLPVAMPGDTVVIKREAVSLIDPQKYRLPLYLSPIKSVTLAAPIDGLVRDLAAKPREKLQGQAEVARLDDTYQKIRLQRAQSLLKVALLEQKLVESNAPAEKKDLAQAKVEAAEADVALAEHEAEMASLRMPFAGEVLRFLVSEGQYVKAGQPVALVGDVSQLQVEIPAERGEVQGAKTLPLKIEGQSVEAQVQSVMPLDPKFDSLRELFDSITSAVLVVDNTNRQFEPGQTVFVPLIPRHAVTEVPTSAIGNQSDGSRKVQVLRDGVVRDISIVLMGSVGVDRVFVSGPFTPGDEAITETSHQLSDGFPVRTASVTSERKGGGSGSATPSNVRPKNAISDF